MFRTMIAATLMAGPALAEAHLMDTRNLISTEDLIDAPIYGLDEDVYDEARWGTDPYGFYDFDERFEEIGEIEDIVLDRSGQMVGVIAEIGGWLGLGENTVMLPMTDVRLTGPTEGVGFYGGERFAIVTRLTEEQAEALPDVDGTIFD